MGHVGFQCVLLHFVAVVCQVAGGYLSVQQGAAQSAGGGAVDGGAELPAGFRCGQAHLGAVVSVPDRGGGCAHGHRGSGRSAGGLFLERVGGCERAAPEGDEESEN